MATLWGLWWGDLVGEKVKPRGEDRIRIDRAINTCLTSPFQNLRYKLARAWDPPLGSWLTSNPNAS